MKKNNLLINYGLLLSIAVIWGSQFIFNSIAISVLSPLTIATCRVIFGAITISLLSLILSKKAAIPSVNSWSVKLRYLFIALFEGVLPFYTIVWGQQYVNSSITAILIGTIPIFTTLWVLLFVPSEKVSVKTILSIFSGFIGLFILISGSLHLNQFNNLYAELAILTGAISFSIALVLIRSMPPIPPLQLMRNVLWLAAIPLVINLVIFNPHAFAHLNSKAFLAVLILGIFCSGIVLVLYAKLIERAGATFTSMCNYLVPLFGTFLGISIMGDQLRPSVLIALGIIFASLLINKLPFKTKTEKTVGEINA